VSHPTLYSETDGGGGEPLVLLHGWGMNLRVFDALRATLGDHYRVTAIDLPGHGRSAWTEAASAQAQLAALAVMLPRDATLVGWSLGGQFALQLAAEPALAVRRLVLVASSPRFVRAPDWPHGLPQAVLRQFAQQLETDPAGTLAEFLDLLVRGSEHAAAVRSTLHHALQRHGEPDPQALAAGLALLEQHDLRELAQRIDVPALVIAGQYDRVTPPQASAALAQLLPRGQLLQIARAGHAPFLSHPEAVTTALLAFPHHVERAHSRIGTRAAP
jgi:pimeloyl-[acyl-carrier protein] methyl ester esterase